MIITTTNPLVEIFREHPYGASVIGTWLLNNVVTALISSLPAPTKDSSARYVYLFKVTNTIIGNVKRAQSTALESSPNWQDAVKRLVDSAASPTGTSGAINSSVSGTP